MINELGEFSGGVDRALFAGLSDGQDCSIFHMGEEIRIRKKAKNPIESGLVVVSIGEVEQIVQTIKEFEAST